MKKILLLIIIASNVFAFSGCAKQSPAAPTPAAAATPTVPPNVTNTEGRVMETEIPGVEGMVTDLTDEKIDVKLQGEIWSFVLSDNAKKELGIRNKDVNNKRIEPGTFVVVYYEEKDSVKYAQNLEILIAN